MGPARIPPSHRVGLLLALLASALYFTGSELTLAGRIGLPLDDAWIHASLARNIAEGHPLSPNPGDPAVPCSTAPLWTFLEAALLKATGLLGAGSDPDGTAAVAVAKALGLACGYLACLLLWRLVRAVTDSLPLAFFGAALLATQPRFVWGVLSGLEVPLYTALVLLGLNLHLRTRDEGGWRRHLPLPVFVAAVFSRPECLLFFPILWLDRFLFGGPEARAPSRALRDGLLSLAALAVFPAFNLLLWGRPFPTTFYVKAEAGSVFAVLGKEGVGTTLQFVGTAVAQQELLAAAFFPALFLPLVLAAGRGGVRLLSERRASVLPFAFLAFGLLHGLLGPSPPTLQSGRRFFMMPPLFLATALAGLGPLRVPRAGRFAAAATALVAAAVALKILLGFDLSLLGAFARYFYLGESTLVSLVRELEPVGVQGPALRFAAGLAFLHVAAAAAGIAVAREPGKRTLLAVLAPCLVLALCLAQQVAGLADHARAYARNVRDTDALNVASGLWVRDHLPTGALVAVHDFGAIAYFGRRRVLDLEGIATPEAIDARAKGLVELLRRMRPTHYVGAPGGLRPAYADAFKELAEAGQLDRKPLHEITLSENATVAGGTIVVARFNW